jgi:diguanylate cyclase (GGDEF)-like protein/PAS domain S-box-containing protein
MQDSLYREILDHLYDGVYFVDRDRRITFWNKGAERITGYAADAVSGRCCSDNLLMHVDDSGTQLCQSTCPLLKTLCDGAPREAQVFLHHADGHRVPVLVRAAPLWGADGEVIGAVETFSDNSSMMALRQRVLDLDDAVFRDTLTGIGNRRYLDVKLDSVLTERRRYGRPVGALLADIDHFKQVNDRFGHEIGDRVLAMVARTLSGNVRSTDVVGRWGGEEFIMLLPNLDPAMLVDIANKLRLLVDSSALTVGANTINVTLSVGATLVRPDDTPVSLVDRADRLMYDSKQGGRNRVSADRDMSAAATEA